jgi:hypothetical protein
MECFLVILWMKVENVYRNKEYEKREIENQLIEMKRVIPNG